MDAEVAKLQEPYAGTPFDFAVEAVEPMRRIVFRWHPYAVDKTLDLAREPMTTIEFLLQDADKGTQLTIVESGFGALPESRRAEAFAANDGGWSHQLVLLRKFVDVPGG